MLEYRDIYAGGRLVPSASPDVITIVNPATEEVIGAVPSEQAGKVRVGNQLDEGTTMGPLASPRRRSDVEIRVRSGRGEAHFC